MASIELVSESKKPVGSPGLPRGGQHPSVAPLTNVSLVVQALERAQRRAVGLPGILCLYGPSGWGKSTAAAFAANKTRAYYIQMQSLWTRRSFLMAVAEEMGLPPAKDLPTVAARIGQQLMLSGRPLIIDEADVLAERDGGAGLIKDLYESTLGVILLIGEERLPQKLLRWERLHGRILEWLAAQPCTLDDARNLTRIYCPGVDVEEDLLSRLVKLAKGSVRRVAVNLDNLRNEASKQGWSRVNAAQWGERTLYTGEPALRRI